MATVYYTLEEISKHNGKNGSKTWIIIKNAVYDVTEYIKKDEHPGGVELIEEWAGKDASRAFDDVGHSGDAKADLKKLKIGEVAEEDRNKSQIKSKSASKPENGTKDNSSKPVIIADNDVRAKRSCLAIITCGLMA